MRTRTKSNFTKCFFAFSRTILIGSLTGLLVGCGTTQTGTSTPGEGQQIKIIGAEYTKQNGCDIFEVTAEISPRQDLLMSFNRCSTQVDLRDGNTYDTTSIAESDLLTYSDTTRTLDTTQNKLHILGIVNLKNRQPGDGRSGLSTCTRNAHGYSYVFVKWLKDTLSKDTCFNRANVTPRQVVRATAIHELAHQRASLTHPNDLGQFAKHKVSAAPFFEWDVMLKGYYVRWSVGFEHYYYKDVVDFCAACRDSIKRETW